MRQSLHCSLHSFTRITLLLLFCGITVRVNGQAAPPQAAIRFANASALASNVMFTNDTRKLRPGGFGPGEYTSSIGTPAGSHRLALTSAGVKTAEKTMALQANTATTIIAFVKPIVDPTTHQTIQQLEIYSQPDPARDGGKHFFLLYVSARPTVDLMVNGQQRNIPAMQQLKVDDLAHGSIKIESNGRSILSFAAQQKGNFLAIVFDKPDGTLSGMLLPDYD